MSSRRMNANALELCNDSGEALLRICESHEGKTMTLMLEGEIPADVAPDFEDELMAAFTVSLQVIIDFRSVSYISNRALQALLSTQQILDETEGKIMVCRLMPGTISQLFREAGLYEILNVEDLRPEDEVS